MIKRVYLLHFTFVLALVIPNTTRAESFTTQVQLGYSKYLNNGPGGFGIGTKVNYKILEDLDAELHLGHHQGTDEDVLLGVKFETTTKTLPITLGASYTFFRKPISPYTFMRLGMAVLNQDAFLNGESITSSSIFDSSSLKQNEVNLALELGGGANYQLENGLLIGITLGYSRIFTEPTSLEILALHGNLGYAFAW